MMSKNGQTLVEVVLAIGLATIVIGAIAILGTTSLRVSKSSLRRSEAAKLASAGIESVRYVRDSKDCGLELLDVPDTGEGSYYAIDTDDDEPTAICGVLVNLSLDDSGVSVGLGSNTYNRKIFINQYEGKNDIVFVRVTVTWNESTGVPVEGTTIKQKSVILSSVLKEM